jgi:hypothetical protein
MSGQPLTDGMLEPHRGRRSLAHDYIVVARRRRAISVSG